jgi:hypothetical protein
VCVLRTLKSIHYYFPPFIFTWSYAFMVYHTVSICQQSKMINHKNKDSTKELKNKENTKLLRCYNPFCICIQNCSTFSTRYIYYYLIKVIFILTVDPNYQWTIRYRYSEVYYFYPYCVFILTVDPNYQWTIWYRYLEEYHGYVKYLNMIFCMFFKYIVGYMRIFFFKMWRLRNNFCNFF